MGFFKAYDMRGTFGVDFDLDTVTKIGEALPKVVVGSNHPPRWLVAHDTRLTSDDINAALKNGLEAAGAQITDLGLATTPMVYFFTAEDDYDGSVMITASHNPPSDNGLKVSKKNALPVGYSSGLKEVEELVTGSESSGALRACSESSGALRACSESSGALRACSESSGALRQKYIEWQKNATNPKSFANLNYAVDCSNGMISILADSLFKGAELLNSNLDGAFPCHSPNPLAPQAREELAEFVRSHNLDCGVIFDGDADRAMFIDERGEFVQPDMLIPLVAKACFRALNLTSGKVIHDIRTSRGVIETLKGMGAEPIMVPVGHAFAKPILRESGAICGGELAGHYYFKEFFSCDSGALAAMRILSEIALAKKEGKSFSQLMNPIISRYANSGELNFRIDDKNAALNRVLDAAKKHLPQEISRSEIDGVRVEFEDGWFNIRLSNTEPYLRLIVECKSPSLLDEWLDILKKAIG